MDTDLPQADELAAVFARMSGLLLSSQTVDTALALITTLVTETIRESDGAGVTLLDDHGARITAAATDPVVGRLDGLQYELDEGPCLTAWERRTAVRVDDVTRENRWPRWASAASATGVRAVLSVPLVAGEAVLGAMKVYSHRAGNYDNRDEQLMMMFAAHSAVLLDHVRSYEDAIRVSAALRTSLRTRDLVNMAKGVLMARDGVDERTAFLLLSRTAEQDCRTLRHVAESVTGATARRLR